MGGLWHQLRQWKQNMKHEMLKGKGKEMAKEKHCPSKLYEEWKGGLPEKKSCPLLLPR